MSFFKRKTDEMPGEKRCGGCCCSCPASAPKCNKGRAAFGLPMITEDKHENQKDT